jgi:hypothetical protein
MRTGFFVLLAVLFLIGPIDALSLYGGSFISEPAAEEMSDEEFLDLVQERAFRFFWNEANASNGLIRDRNTFGSPASIASVGFGLTAIGIGIEREWISREAGRERVLTTLETFWTKPQGRDATGYIGYNGFFYHFIDMNTTLRMWESELSSIDTALLLAGILYAKEYFTGEHEEEQTIRELADSIYHRVDWNWMRNWEPTLTMGWHPETGFITHRWIGYNEAMILYILAAGSPTKPLTDPVRSWNGWTSGYSWETHYGYQFVVFPPLFGHQYSHAWIDFRNINDTYMTNRGITYFENSRRATLANREYCIDNPGNFVGYGENVWGITASDYPHGYIARGAPPPMNDEGTIAPTAAGGSTPFTPEESIAALRYMYEAYYDDLWGVYGFKDAFNLSHNWFATDYIGIDQGAIVLMIENYRTEHVWDLFMGNEDVQNGLAAVGFTGITTVDDEPEAIPVEYRLNQNYPNPFNPSTSIDFTIPVSGRVYLAVYNMLGQRIALLVDGHRDAGQYTVHFNPAELPSADLPSGVYFYTMRSGDFTSTGRMLYIR